jgi:xanthine dehydrogenase accessory factor
LEKDAERRALEALTTQRSVVYSFALEADLTTPEGAICGGGVRILIDADPARHLPVFQALVDSLARRSSGALITSIVMSKESEVELSREWVHGPGEDLAGGGRHARYRDRIEACIKQEKAELFPVEKGASPAGPAEELLLCEPFVPLPRLLIAGAGHIGAAVTHLGSRLEFEVTVIDDRSEFANPENLPDADHIIHADIGRAMREMDIGADSYIIIVTRGHRHDGEALRGCIASPAAYLGMIGSRHKIALMRRQFIEEGWATAEQWDRIHTPIGLEIGSQTVEEIAVSIAAQLVSVRSRVHGLNAGS